MVRLKNGDLITEEIKKAFKEKTTYSYLDVYNGETLEYTISYDDYLTKVEYYDDKCDPEDGKFIGKATTRQIDVEIKNIDNQFNIDGKEVEYVIGVFLDNGETAEISYGRFIPSEIENKEIEETTTFTAYDYMAKTDIPYTCTIKAFPVTLVDFAKDVCSQCGVNLGNTNFRNANKRVINANPFQGGENCREVVKSIAKLSFSVAYIDVDNRLYFGFEQKDIADEEITTDDYFELSPNTQPEPLNKVTLRSSEVTASGQSIGYKGNYSNDLYYLVGDIVNYNDTKYYCIQEGKGNLPTNETYWKVYTAFEINDVKELIIEEDYFAYTDTLRNEFLKEAVDLYGLVYYPVEIDLLGSIYLQFNDTLKITNSKNKELKTYCFNNDHTYNGVLYNTITSPSLTDEEEKHDYQTEQDNFSQRTYIEINKANQSILAAIKKIGEATSQYVKLKAQLDEIEAEIGSITDITITGEGYGKLTFTDINQSEPIYMRIHAQGEDITPLYPSDNLYPRNDLYPHNREIIFKNTTDGTEIEYNLPSNLYYLDEDTYDEFVLDYENTQCYVIHRVEIIEGQKVKRTNEIIENIDDYPSIPLTEGDYTITIPYCLSAYLYIRLMAKNIYTSQFATQVQLNSAITQTESSITQSVNAEIAKANGEIEKISGELSLKLDTNKLVSTINAQANVITITSDYFKLTADGHITATGGTIAGLTMSTNSEGSSYLYKSFTSGSSKYQSGLYIPKTTTGSSVFLYAGVDITSGSNLLTNSNFYVTHNGNAYARNFNIISDGALNFWYSNGKIQSSYNRNSITRYNDDGAKWIQEGRGFSNGTAISHTMWIYNAQYYQIQDGVHKKAIVNFHRINDSSSSNLDSEFYSDIHVWGTRQTDGITNSIYIRGYEVSTNASDERLKENIVDCTENASEIIAKIPMISFDWKKDIHTKEAGQHIPIGYGAQRTQKEYDKAVNYNEENDTYQMNLINLSSLHTKSIQEILKRLEKLENGKTY